MKYIVFFLILIVGCTGPTTKDLVECETEKVKLEKQLESVIEEIDRKPKEIIKYEKVYIDTSLVEEKTDSMVVDKLEDVNKISDFKVSLGDTVGYVSVQVKAQYRGGVLYLSAKLLPDKTKVVKQTTERIQIIKVPDLLTEKENAVLKAVNNELKESQSKNYWIVYLVLAATGVFLVAFLIRFKSLT
jgi:hypothetical protein